MNSNQLQNHAKFIMVVGKGQRRADFRIGDFYEFTQEDTGLEGTGESSRAAEFDTIWSLWYKKKC